jgi:hypothetical protein
MKNLVVILALFTAASSGAQDKTNNPSFRFPVRVINNQRVDLRYLFARWHTGDKPVTNSPWVLLTGTIANDRMGTWVVDGKTTSASGVELHQKVLLLNPPRGDKQNLEKLQAEQHDLKKENSTLEGEENSLQKKAASPPKPTRHHWVAPNYQANIDQKETNVLNQESGVEGQLSQINKQLEAIPTTKSETGMVYRVDFFAFSTGRAQNGMPVLDFGIPTR